MAMRLSMALVLLMGVGVFALAQEEKKEAADEPGSFKVSGETIDDFKVEFTHPDEPDLSTPMGAAKACIAISDGRSSFEDQEVEVFRKWGEAAQKALKPFEEKLLSEEALEDRKALAKKREELRSRPSSGGVLPVTLGETKELEDGRVQISGTSHEYSDWKGERKEYASPVRYTLKKGEDGKWRIDKVEGAWEDEDEEGNKTFEWYEDYGVLEMYYNYAGAAESLEAVPALKQDTPENAALSLTGSLCRRWTLLDWRFYDKVMTPYMNALESLCTKEWKDYLKEVAKGDEDAEEPKPREVESVRDGEGGIKIVRFKPEQEWNGPLDIHVKKSGDLWQVVCAKSVKLPESEDGEEEYQQLEDIYAASWN
jgi:hypothetical protein